MGILRSIYRYFATIGGLIESDIDGKTNDMLTTPSGIKATFKKTREQWTTQYSEVRESVAQLMTVLETKRSQVEALDKEAQEVKTKMNGAVEKYQQTKEEKYQQAFVELFNQDKDIAKRQEALNAEIAEMKSKVESYKDKLKDMQSRITDLDQKESEAIADIVSSKQIISLNDRLNNVSTELDDENLKAIENRRQNLKTQAKLSGELAEASSVGPNLDKELMQAGMKSEAADVFAAMVAEKDKGEEAKTGETERQREI